MKIEKTIIPLICLISFIFLTACTEDEKTVVVDQSPLVKEVIVDLPAENKAKIEEINLYIEKRTAEHKESKALIQASLRSLEEQLKIIRTRVENNSATYKELVKKFGSIASKTVPYKKNVVKKATRKKRRVTAAPKPKYKVIGIDQWGKSKYVQLIDESGNLRVLREGEKIDKWVIRDVRDSGVTLVDSKGKKLNVSVTS